LAHSGLSSRLVPFSLNFSSPNHRFWDYSEMALILTVSELTRTVRDVLEGHIGEVWVEGEISNYRKQSSGHHYFTLKDERSQVACVMFARSYGAQSRVPLSDGMQIQAYGRVTVYEARGQYQLIVQLVQSKGRGLLQAKFEALKRKLLAEGLFEKDRKRALPKFPRRVALVTSPTGAALQDMLNILQRRNPWLSVLICPVRVQGEGASTEISEMIRQVSLRAQEWKIDVMIVARGGGSFEDLWEFNEENVARAIFSARIPVISAVGHEIDFTIADFVADVRAPTPSAAAEILAPDILKLQGELAARRSAMDRLARQALEICRVHLARLAGAACLREPAGLLVERQQKIDQLELRLSQAGSNAFAQRHSRIAKLMAFLSAFRPDHLLDAKRREVALAEIRLKQVVLARIQSRKHSVRRLTDSIRLLGPQQTLERGYSITLDANRNVVRSAGTIKVGDTLCNRFADGEAHSVAVRVARPGCAVSDDSAVFGESAAVASNSSPEKPGSSKPGL
jgi:exodeoxyribonuclease VII large subunit